MLKQVIFAFQLIFHYVKQVPLYYRSDFDIPQINCEKSEQDSDSSASSKKIKRSCSSCRIRPINSKYIASPSSNVLNYVGIRE